MQNLACTCVSLYYCTYCVIYTKVVVRWSTGAKRAFLTLFLPLFKQISKQLLLFIFLNFTISFLCEYCWCVIISNIHIASHKFSGKRPIHLIPNSFDIQKVKFLIFAVQLFSGVSSENTFCTNAHSNTRPVFQRANLRLYSIFD